MTHIFLSLFLPKVSAVKEEGTLISHSERSVCSSFLLFGNWRYYIGEPCGPPSILSRRPVLFFSFCDNKPGTSESRLLRLEFLYAHPLSRNMIIPYGIPFLPSYIYIFSVFPLRRKWFKVGGSVSRRTFRMNVDLYAPSNINIYI